MRRHQALPHAGPARAMLQEKGQFWTPDWVADAMAAYVLQSEPDHVFDPAVGAGAFFQAIKRVSSRSVCFSGCEVDPVMLEVARDNGLNNGDRAAVELRDFALEPPPGPFRAIIANPPYLRHHRLSAETKATLRQFSGEVLGRPLDGRAGLHVYFLLRALTLLALDGRLAFLLPADVCEGVFAPFLWQWITRNFCLDAVISFTPTASPFPGVDTNALVFLLRRAAPEKQFWSVQCTDSWSDDLRQWVETKGSTGSLRVTLRQVAEAIQTGISRSPADVSAPVGPVLGDFARVLRGIATGDNRFFFLTRAQVERIGLPETLLRRAVGRTRDVTGEMVTDTVLEELDASGRPTYLFAPDGRALSEFDAKTQQYLQNGEKEGLPHRSLIATRNPWYKMERRDPPPFLFAYLGRRNTRFICNHAGVVPLTGFLCVYPHGSDSASRNSLWEILRHPETIANLAAVGKSYGSGAIKVEPRSLERLPLPASVVARTKIFVPKLILESSESYG